MLLPKLNVAGSTPVTRFLGSLAKSRIYEPFQNRALHRRDDGTPFVVQIRPECSARSARARLLRRRSFNPHRGDREVVREGARGVSADTVQQTLDNGLPTKLSGQTRKDAVDAVLVSVGIGLLDRAV